MKAAGVIAEFNPMHQGHRFLLEKIRQTVKPDVLIVIMSTWFSSRGLPCLESVETRTRLALQAGADLVIALPVPYTMQSADYFALYSIEALKTAQVNLLCFGSESADLALLEENSRQVSTLKANPATSQARNAARQVLVARPNDILAMQYIRYAREFGIECHPILRDQSLKSATQTRIDYFNGVFQEEDHLFEKEQRLENYYPLIRYILLESDPKWLASLFLVDEGIENRLIQAARTCTRWQDFLACTISKTYSKARIQRTCMMILLQIPKKEMKKHDSFFQIQVLGFNPAGQKWLKSLPKGTPIATRFRELPGYLQNWELKASRLYSLVGQKEYAWKVVIERDPSGIKAATRLDEAGHDEVEQPE